MKISKFRDIGKILWLGSKFRGLRKTVGPTDDVLFNGINIDDLDAFEHQK